MAQAPPTWRPVPPGAGLPPSPYGPPGAPPAGAPGWGPPAGVYPPAWQAPPPRFEDPRGNLGIILVLGALFIAASVGYFVGFLAFFSRIFDAIPTDPATAPAGPPAFVFEGLGFMMAAMVAFLAVSLAQALVSGFWLMRAARNIRALGGAGFSWSPGWAIGGWFIPYANWVIPLLVIREVYKGSRPENTHPASWQAQRVPGWVGWWWALWVGAPVLLQIPFWVMMGAGARTGETDLGWAWLLAVPAALLVVALVLYMRLLREIAASQVAAARMRHLLHGP